MRPLAFRCPPDMIDRLDRAAERSIRSRSGQILHYIREGMRRDGLLPEPDSDPARSSNVEPAPART